MLADRAMARSADREHYYIGLLEGVLGECVAASLATQRNPVEVANWAERAYENFHWGRPADETIETEGPTLAPGETLLGLGELVEITYRTRKGRERADYWHDFGRPRPLLTAKRDGCLIIVGGGYKITPRGIVG